MKKSELLEKLKEFKYKIGEYSELCRYYLNEKRPENRFNYVEKLQKLQEELNKKFPVLEEFINQYSRDKIKHIPSTGMKWDIYKQGIRGDVDRIKVESLNSVIRDLGGIIAKVEAEAKEEIDIIEDRDSIKETKERDRKIKVFLSYSSLNKKLAGQLKYALEDYGLEVFLAHEDIEPSAEWVDTIINELKACDIFIPIITENFKESDWTDQEIGIAFAYNKVIIPIKLAADPHGFISRYQALKIDTNKIKSSCCKLVKVISSNPILRDLLNRDDLIKKFGNSRSFENAANNTELLLSIEGFTIHQVTDIIKHTINNKQINESSKARNKLSSFIYDYKDHLDPKLLEAFYEAIKLRV